METAKRPTCCREGYCRTPAYTGYGPPNCYDRMRRSFAPAAALVRFEKGTTGNLCEPCLEATPGAEVLERIEKKRPKRSTCPVCYSPYAPCDCIINN